MNNNDKTTWDGVILVAAYHFLMAIVSLMGSAAIFVFAIIPNSTKTGLNPQSIFFPIIGALIGIILCLVYGITGSGLVRLKNSARMGAVFMAIFGAIGGLFVLVGAGIPIVNSVLPDWASVAGIGIAGICGYLLTTIMDVIVLVFLFSRRSRAIFYGEPYSPENVEGSISRRIRNVFIGDNYDLESGQSMAVPSQRMRSSQREELPSLPTNSQSSPIAQQESQQALRRREINPPSTPTQVQPPASTPPAKTDDFGLDTPGDLFTEPTPRKK